MYPRHRKKPPKKKRQKKVRSVEYLLEIGTLTSMRAAQQRTQDLLDYHWLYYSELAFQRNQQIDEIKAILVESSIPDFEFKQWQRAVRYKYSLHPFCTLGSVTNIGQRFNMGKEINSNLPSHSALYVAIDKDTALQETLGQEPSAHAGLNPRDWALANPQSETIVSVSGYLEKVFDLRNPESLDKLMVLLKTFTISPTLKKRAVELEIDLPGVVQDSEVLRDSLLEKDWRKNPQNFDVPSNSQIFGHLLSIAGIEGVVYPSKLTGKDALAIFVTNFENGSSFIQLDDEAPLKTVPKRIDSKSWPLCEFNFDDLVMPSHLPTH